MERSDDVLRSSLSWLADAPLFLDAEQVTAFYDATIRPEYEGGVITLSRSDLESKKSSKEGSAGAQIGTSTWLTAIFPFLDAKVSINGKIAKEDTTTTQDAETIELRPINTPQRQLVQLALHYAANLSSRLAYSTGSQAEPWLDASFAQTLPRGLVFMDLPPDTRIIPIAAELNEGRVVTFYDKLVPALSRATKTLPPDYPGDGRSVTQAEQMRSEYWAWYTDNFESRDAMRVVEEVISDSAGRIRWIDFRVLLAQKGAVVHLHMAGREQYDTGVFAYNFVRRCFRYGIRIVGTLKSGLDLNVLAVFDT